MLGGLSGGVSVWGGLYLGGLCPGGLCPGRSVQGGLCAGGGVSVQYGNVWAVRILLECILVTGHNEVVEKVMFLQVCVCPQGGVCLSACWDARPPQTRQDPPGPGRPLPDQADPPRPGRHPPGPGRHSPRPGRHPPPEADSSIRSMSSRYASYWNAFFFMNYFYRPGGAMAFLAPPLIRY